MEPGPLLFGLLVALGIFMGFLAVWRLTSKPDPVEYRLRQYGINSDTLGGVDTGVQYTVRRPRLTGINRLLAGFGLGPSLADELAQADLPLTAAEYTLIILVCGLAGALIGLWRESVVVGLALALLFSFLPVFYLRNRRRRRQRTLTDQIPEMLSLLVGALRAGYGLTQSLEIMAEQMAAPMATEVQRTLRSVGLGLPVQRALSDMATRISTDEMDMVVTAINVQYETGGNLAQTLEIIGVTIRDRLRIKREIQVLTAQQRLTGYILVLLPFMLAIVLFLINPDYMRRLFEPGWIRLMPVTALVMMLAGFLIMRRIVDIEV